MPPIKGSLRTLGKMVWELFLATYGSTLAANMLVYMLFPFARVTNPGLSLHQLNRIISLPYFPLQIIVGFTVGYVRSKRHRTAISLWVWTVPLLLLAVHFASFNPGVFGNPWMSRINHFFGSACRPPACFDQTSYTSPFYASIAYVIGVLTSMKMQPTSKNEQTPESP
jgi:hypothetical protein